MGQRTKARIAVYVKGGNVQDVISDRHGVEVMVVDYDNEKCTGVPDREFLPARRDEQLLMRTIDGLESD